jgi:hypothetical protein
MPIDPQWLIDVATDMKNVFQGFMISDDDERCKDPDNESFKLYLKGRAVMKGHMDVVMDYLIQKSQECLAEDKAEEAALLSPIGTPIDTKHNIN